MISASVLSACSFSFGDGALLGGDATPPPQAAERREEPKGPTPMDTFRALAPPEGMKFTQLFVDPVKDGDARVRRIEDAVQALRNDFDMVVPSVVRLAAVEKDMKDLISQLKTLTDEQPAAPAQPVASELLQETTEIPGGDVTEGTENVPDREDRAEPKVASPLVTPEAAPKGLPPEGAASPSSTPRPAAAPPKKEPPPPPQENPEAKPPGKVTDVRVGDHPDRTRIVFDVTAKASFVAKLADGGKTLIVEMPDMDWRAIGSYVANSGALVSAWRVEGGNRLVMDLLYPSSISMQDLLPPEGTQPYRLVIDLHSPAVHK